MMNVNVTAPNGIAPSLEEIQRLVTSAGTNQRTVPMSRVLLADMETPVSVYLKLTRGCREPGFLLESIEGGTRIARYSFIGAAPQDTLVLRDGSMHGAEGGTAYDDPLVAVQNVIERFRTDARPDLPRFTGGAVGYLSFDAVRRFEPRVPQPHGPGLGLPEASFHIADTIVVFDHLERVLKVVTHCDLSAADMAAEYERAVAAIDAVTALLDDAVPGYDCGSGAHDDRPVEARGVPNVSREQYESMVARAQEYIRQGDIFQVVPSQRVDIPTPAHPFSIYRSLRTVNPSPYMFYLDFVDHQIVGASPELLVRVDDGVVSNHPIAGTRPRGTTDADDSELASELITDEKERAEHIMLVDLGRNDVGRVSKPGTVRVPKLMDIEKFSHVMHIVSNVDGDLRDDLEAVDALRACFPAGTVSGAPKVRAMEIIAELEPDSRGIYAGAVGYIDFSGEMDTCIALRTLVYKDGVASLQAGGGVVADSSPAGEYYESLHKMRALVRALERAEDLDKTRVASTGAQQ